MSALTEVKNQRPQQPAPIQAGKGVAEHMADWDRYFRELSAYLLALHAGPHAREINELKARISQLEEVAPTTRF